MLNLPVNVGDLTHGKDECNGHKYHKIPVAVLYKCCGNLKMKLGHLKSIFMTW